MKRLGIVLTLLFVVSATLGLIGCGATLDAFLVESPYEGVNWDTWIQVRANLHTHTSESDGIDDPDRVIDEYNDRGYTVLALTDHDFDLVFDPDTSWPWSRWGRDPQALGMIAIEGNELTQFYKHHINSFYSSYESTASTDEDDWLSDIQELGGLAYLNHPYWHLNPRIQEYALDKDLAWYEDMLISYPALLGIEVHSGASGGEPRYDRDYNLALWDDILGEVLDERQVWGFASDDSHEPNDIGSGFSTLVVPEVSDSEVREALEKGRFYFSDRDPDGPPCPRITSIDVDEKSGTITIEATDYDGMTWISAGVEVGEGETFQYRGNQGVDGYVRAMLSNGTSITGTQAIKIERVEG